MGDTVYATGNFTKARPAGAALGAASSASRSDLLAYSLTTGALITSFNHVLNGQGLAIVASPDNKRIYVGGDFTTVDGKSHRHLAAFDATTGALISSFAPNIGGQVRALCRVVVVRLCRWRVLHGQRCAR